MTMEDLAQQLRDAGCDTAVAFGTYCRVVLDGMPARVVPDGNGGLAIRMAVSGDDLTLDLARVNYANTQVRFAQYSVQDGQLVMRCDLDYQEGDSVVRHVMIWRSTVIHMRKLVVELAETSPIA